MDLNAYLAAENELPLERIPTDGGFTAIFRTIGCIGDSLSSGEFQSLDENGKVGYHDYYDYSWGQYLARMVGSKVYNFSRGGMTSFRYHEFAQERGFWDPEKACQAYILALGVNEYNQKLPLGSIEDIDFENPDNNAQTFVGQYARIIQRYKTIQPKAKFFLMTIPRASTLPERIAFNEAHQALIYQIAEKFDYTYVLDFQKYAPVYDEEFHRNFFLAGHMNPMGYMLTARMVGAYIDYIIRHNMEDFSQVGFIGTPYHNCGAKW